jgi:hypothetical protein
MEDDMKSKLVPYILGEHPGTRHERRLEKNLGWKGCVAAWARRNRVTLKITNHGHHWRFTKKDREAEWWPSSARLVRQRKYDHALRVHDYQQAIEVLDRHFRKSVSK